jgi:dTDP-4-amino-4,6-dideoxygalactose transaminase
MKSIDQPAILGGTPTIDRKDWPTWPPRTPDITEALRAVVEEDQWGIRSEAVAKFETAFAAAHESEYALAMGNGTLALYAALKAVDIGRGDEVIVPAYTFMASAVSVLQAGGTPILADIDPATYNLDPQAAKEKITEKTKAIMPVHIGGNPADMNAFIELGQKYGLAIIEDAAQAPGAGFGGKPVGAIGDAGSFSFQSSKNITAGEGGILLTNNKAVYEQAFEIYNCGRSLKGDWYHHAYPGTNLRLSAFQAAVLLAQMKKLESWSKTREENGRYLEHLLKQIPGITPVQRYPETTRNAYHLLIFAFDSAAFSGMPKSRFLEAMMLEGVVATSGYTPLNTMPFLKGDTASYPVTEDACERGVWIRQFELLAPRPMMDKIIEAIEIIQHHAQEIAAL